MQLEQIREPVVDELRRLDEVIVARLASDVVLVNQVSPYIVGAGGAPMSAALEARVSQRLGVPSTQGYGMTEVTAVLTLGFTPATMRPGSVGKLLPAVQMRVVDPATGHDMRYGQ